MTAARPLAGLRIAVVGGGVLGLGVAALAARRGASVALFDPRPLGENASGVAAGMLAPVLEAACEETPGRAPLLMRAYAAWPAFARAAGLEPPRDLAAGALYVGDAAALEVMAARLAALGADAKPLDAAATRARQPALGEVAGGLLIGDEGRLDPRASLRALAASLEAAGGRRIAEAADAARLQGYDAIVVASGYAARAWRDRAPELASLSPIKGHILHFPNAALHGPTVRSVAGYLTPQASGAVFGASMQPGREDLEVEAPQTERLRRAAEALAPGLAGAPFVARTGVRASTPDGLPLVGRSASGLFLATGARRNGWLLAPLVATSVLDTIAAGEGETAFAPGRFACG